MLYLTPPQPYPPSTRLLPTKVKRREIATASTLKTSLKKQSRSVQSLIICILSQYSCVVGNPECKCPFKRHFRGIKISVFACSFTRDKRRSICECVSVCPQDFQLTQIWFGVNSEALVYLVVDRRALLSKHQLSQRVESRALILLLDFWLSWYFRNV